MIRNSAPEIKTIKSLKTGFPEREKNLYKLISDEGVFKLEIVFPNAGYGVINNKFHGIYALDMLLSGTGHKSADKIAEQIDCLGGYVFKGCDYYTSSITLFGMNENILKLIDILKDAMTNCIFNKKELDIYKSRKISELNINLNKTSFLANRSINQLLTGTEHPYSLISTEERINSIEPEDLMQFKNEYLDKPFFIFTGSDSTNIEKILESSGFEVSEHFSAMNTQDREIHEVGIEQLISRQGSTQNSIRMGKLLPSRSHHDFFTINLFNLVLGGYFGSRLMKNIREEKGLTYGIHSSLTPFKSYSLFKISSECNSQLSSQVKQEIYNEIGILQTQTIDHEELTTAKNYLMGALARNFDGAFNVSERLKSFLELDSDKDYYARYFNAINQITADQIQECANNYFDLNSFKYCIAGEV